MFSSTIRQRISQPYMWAVISLGTAACVFTVTRLQPATLGLRFILISLVTLAFGSRVSVKIPRVRGQISISRHLHLLRPAVLRRRGGHPVGRGRRLMHFAAHH